MLSAFGVVTSQIAETPGTVKVSGGFPLFKLPVDSLPSHASARLRVAADEIVLDDDGLFAAIALALPHPNAPKNRNTTATQNIDATDSICPISPKSNTEAATSPMNDRMNAVSSVPEGMFISPLWW